MTSFRVHDPALGRWWQQDPIIKYHESPYAWVTNNPIRFNDPWGLDTLPEVVVTAKRLPQNSNQAFIPSGPLLQPFPTTTPNPGILATSISATAAFAGVLTAVLVATPTSMGEGDVFFKMLSEEEESRYYELLSKKNFGGGLTPSEDQELQELEEMKYPNGNPLGDDYEVGFKKMPQGDNIKKNEEVHSLYNEYGITDPDDKRRIHDLITRRGLSREEIREVIQEYLENK